MSTLHQLQRAWMEETLARWRRHGGQNAARIAVRDRFKNVAGRAYRVSRQLTKADFKVGIDPTLRVGSNWRATK